MLDAHGRRNHGWRIPKPASTTELLTKTAEKGSEYAEGTLLRQCKAGCGKWVPFGASFHFEECPKQA